MINCIQNKSFCLNNICMCTVYIYYVCINSQTYSIYFENIWKYLKKFEYGEKVYNNRKVASSSLGPAGIGGGGSECPALSPPSIPRRGALEQGTEPSAVPWASQNKWLPTAPGVCSLLCVCTWMEYRARIQSMCHHAWLYVTFTFKKLNVHIF